MLRASLRKIKSAPRPSLVVAAVAGVIVLLWAVVLIAGLRSDAPKADHLLQTESQTYALDAATTPFEQEQGLGGRVGMPANRGMIFVFDRDDRRCFWMKDMHFSLDIIWATADKRVTHIEPKLSPATYPKTYCATGKYVIELNAGMAAVGGIVKGQKLSF